MASLVFCLLVMVLSSSMLVEAGGDNRVYSPCADTTVASGEGFTIGVALASRSAFFVNRTVQLSPCDRRLSLAQIAVFRPKVDEITLLTINSSNFFPGNDGGHDMVAFAGRKHAARAVPTFVSDGDRIVTSFTLVLEFKKGRLENLFWKKEDCAKCSGNSGATCINKQYCAINTQDCKNRGGKVDCSLGIQLAFSGTDKHYRALNSWYEVQNLRQYSLFGLYSNLKNSLSSQYDKLF